MDREIQRSVGTCHTDDLGREATPPHATRPPDSATPFARDLAVALTDPVIVALLAHVVRQGIEMDRALLLARAEQPAPPPPTTIARASSRTDWVGRRFAQQQKREAQPEGATT